MSEAWGPPHLADPGIIFLLSFDDGYVEQKHALTAEIEQPAPIVTGRVNKAARIEKATANLLPNPSFEVGADDWEVPDSAVAILRDTSYHFNGDNTVSVASLRVSGQDLPSSPYTYSTFDVTVNQAYSASAWLYSPGVAVSVMLELAFTGGTPVSDDSGLVEIPPNMWTRVTVDELFSGNNTDGEVRLWLEQSAPLYATGSRVSSWVPGGTALATSTSLALNVGDVLAAAVVDHPPASGAYQFFMVTTGGTGPGDANLRLNDDSEEPEYAPGSRASYYRPASGDSVPVTDSGLVLAAGDLVFCMIRDREYTWHMVTTGATGVSSPSLRLDDEGSPPDFEPGSRLSRFVPTGTALATSTSLSLAAGDIAFCRLVSVGTYDWALVTTGGTGPADAAMRLNDGSTAPAYAAGSRFSYLTPSATALATATTIALAAGTGLFAHTLRAPSLNKYGWHMITTGGTGPASATLRLNDGPTLDKVWLDCVQVEKRTFASSYADYLQGAGYSGAEGTLSNRTAGTLSYLIPQELLPTEGTAGFWLCPNWDADDNETHVLLDIAEEEYKNRMVVKKDAANKLLFAVWDESGGLKQEASTSAVSWSASDWVHIAVTWDGGTREIYLDGEPLATTPSGSRTGVITEIPSSVFLGSSFDGNDQADGLLTDVFLKNVVISPDEADALASGYGQLLGAVLNLGGLPTGRGSGITDGTPGNETTHDHGLAASPGYIHLTPKGPGVV